MSTWKWIGFFGTLAIVACADDGTDGGQSSGGGSAGIAGSSTGGTSGSAGVAGSGGVMDAGTDGDACDALFADYMSALAKAGRCTPGAPSQCEVLVQSNPGCGEYALVEATNTESLADLGSLKVAWDAAGCSISCGVGGHGASEAVCEPSGAEGYCKVTKY